MLKEMKGICWLLLVAMSYTGVADSADQLKINKAECAGMSGFRAHWDQPIPVAENGKRIVKDAKIKDRGQTAVWDGKEAGPLAFDAVHRSLLVRFPEAAKTIADELAKGKDIEKIELVLPYLDEEIWAQGAVDYPQPDGYRYRTNWDCDNLYRSKRPNWHAIAHVLRKPWKADGKIGPTYNAAVNNAVYWKRFGAADTKEDRFAPHLGPAEVSSYKPEGRMDVTAIVKDSQYGKTLADRLKLLSDSGFVINKWEVYDARYFQGAYEWAISTGPRAILIKEPSLQVTFKPGKAETVDVGSNTDVKALADEHKNAPIGKPTAVVMKPEEVVALNEKFIEKPDWMPDWQYKHVKQLMALESGHVEPFYYRIMPKHVINRAIQNVTQKIQKEKGKRVKIPQEQIDYAVYLAWLDWTHGRPPRFFEGHLTAANNIMEWYNFREALPEPMKESVIRCWKAWLMPERKTASDKQMRDFTDTSGELIHPMADDPRVGKDPKGNQAKWNQGDTYYNRTGDWRGNKSFYRSGFTRTMSTANFNSSATSGALLNGQILGAENAMEDGRVGLMTFPFWMWTYNSGVGQEYIDHYYWAIATAGNKLFADFCQQPKDKMVGWSIISKTVEDLGGGYHPNLKKLIGPASRTYFSHVLGEQDGLYHVLHVLSPKGALSDVETGTLPAISAKTNKQGRKAHPRSAWGHDFPPSTVALQSMTGPWAEEWVSELIDEKPLPWSGIFEKKTVSEGDWVTTYFGENYGLSSIRYLPQRLHVLAHWRRKAERPSTMHEVGTLDMRIGYNETRFGNDGAGIISQQGYYRTYQYKNKLIMLATPNEQFFSKLKKQKVTSVQCTAALFNYELPKPAWQIYLDKAKVEKLPATARFGQVITIQDGVTYLALRPLPTNDLGRDIEISLDPEGAPQSEAYHNDTAIAPTLTVNAYFYHKKTELTKADLERLKGCFSGFVVEMGDAKEYGSFGEFQKHIHSTSLDVDLKGKDFRVAYKSGSDTLNAKWFDDKKDAESTFLVNGKSPYPTQEQQLWRDTTLTQMGKGNLEKNGAVIEKIDSKDVMLLQTFPKQKIYVAMNPLPNYQRYSFKEPGGVKIIADGPCSMGRWAVKNSKDFDLRYAALNAKKAPEPAKRATCIFVTGTKGQPSVVLNNKDITKSIKSWSLNGEQGWLVPLQDKLPSADQLKARFAGK